MLDDQGSIIKGPCKKRKNPRAMMGPKSNSMLRVMGTLLWQKSSGCDVDSHWRRGSQWARWSYGRIMAYVWKNSFVFQVHV